MQVWCVCGHGLFRRTACMNTKELASTEPLELFRTSLQPQTLKHQLPKLTLVYDITNTYYRQNTRDLNMVMYW